MSRGTAAGPSSLPALLMGPLPRLLEPHCSEEARGHHWPHVLCPCPFSPLSLPGMDPWGYDITMETEWGDAAEDR